nr:hypothetical protein [uncultured Methanobacterium sp.]
MKTHQINPSKMMGGLCAYITELDSLRPPSRFGVSSQSFSVTMELLLKERQKSYFFKNNPEVKQKISREMRDFRTDTNVDPKEIRLPSIFLAIVIFVTLGIPIGIGRFYYLSILQGCLIIILIGIPLIYLAFSFAIMNRRRVLGERHDEELKRSVQILIDFGVQFCNDNNLDPDMFLIKLRHDDYDGLIYDKKGQNNFEGYFKNET